MAEASSTTPISGPIWRVVGAKIRVKQSRPLLAVSLWAASCLALIFWLLPTAQADILSDTFDRGAADATAPLVTSGSLTSGTTHELFDFSGWPNSVIDVSMDTATTCHSTNAHTEVRIDVRLGTLHEIAHRHYGSTETSDDGLYGDGTAEVTTHSTSFARHGLRLEDNKLLYVSYGNVCTSGFTTRVTGGDYWVFTDYNHAPTVATPIANQQATEDTSFSFQAPGNVFTDIEDAGAPTPILQIGEPAIFNPLDTSRRFSGIFANTPPGVTHGLSRLDSIAGWAALDPEAGHWIELPLPTDQAVYGVITQGRADISQWVTGFTVSVLDVNDVETTLASGAVLSANTNRDTKVFNPLNIPSGSRWLRLYPTTWAGFPAMRVGLAASPWLFAHGDSISGTPSEGEGAATVAAIGRDSAGLSVTDTFVVNVAAVNDAPTVANAVADQSAIEDAAFNVALPTSIFADVDSGDSVTVTVSSKPAWLSFAAGSLSGTPSNADVGEHVITVTGTDSSGATASDTFVVTVANVNDGPTVATPVPDQSATEDLLFEFVVPAASFDDADSGDSLTRSVTSTLPAWLSFNTNTGLFSGTPTNSDVGAVSATVRATDDDGLFAEDSFNISVANVNDSPIVAIAISEQSATEDVAFSFAVPATTFSDDDGDILVLSITSTLPSWLSFDVGTATFSGTPLNGDVAELTVSVQASDATDTVTDTFVVSISNTNDAPTVETALTLQNASEDIAFSYTVPLATFDEIDVGDSLTYSAPTRPTWLSFNAATRTLSGTPSNNHVGNNAVVIRVSDSVGTTAESSFDVVVGNSNDAPSLDQGIPDKNASEDVAFSLSIPVNAFTDPDVGDAFTYSVVAGPSWLSISGNTLSGTPAQADVGSASVTLRATDTGNLSADASFSLSVSEVNDNAPVFNSATAISVSENIIGVLYTASATDADSGDSLTFSISGTDASLFNIVEASGALSFISNPDFEVANDAGANHVYNLSVTATDAADNATSIALAINLLDANDNAPSFSSTGNHNAPEGEGSTGYIATAIDADNGDTPTFAIVGGSDAAHFNINANTGVLSFAHGLDFEQPQDADNNNTYALVLRARDTASNGTSLNLNVVVQDTNDNAPNFTSSGNVSVDENRTAVGYTATATDPDTADTITFGIEPGLDSALFSIDPSTGVLNFVNAPDAETPADADSNNTYLLTLSATDSVLLKSTATLAVVVEDLNDTAPIFASAANISISEDNYSVGYTALATDPDSNDAPALSLNYAIDGGSDKALFSIDSSTGVVAFIAAPDFEAPDDAGGDHVYNLRLEASDTAGNTALHNIAITLLDANDNAPEFTSLPNASLAEGSTGVFYTAIATDPDTNNAVSFSIASGNDAGLFSINATSGALSVSSVDFEQPGAGSANNVYSLTLRASDTGSLDKDHMLVITVRDVNDNPPTITSDDTARVDENTAAIGYTATASDPDTNDTPTWGFGGGLDDALFAIDNNTGALTFITAADAEQPADSGADNTYNVTLRALDGVGNHGDLAVTITVDNLNDNAPMFTSATNVAINENSSASPYTASASDADADALRYEIDSGSDASLFSINSTTGVLSFDQAIDHESPEDAGGDNVYNLLIAAIDPGALRTTLAVAITVNDLNDTAPNFSSGNTVSVIEGNATTGYTAVSTDPDSGDSTSYTLGGPDAALFAIDTNGVLSFTVAPDFEQAGDADSNNVYALTLTATDAASNATDLVVNVTVADANDQSPVFSSPATASISEGSVASFYAAQASDNDAGDSIAYSIIGDDAALFTIDTTTGALSLRVAANFENPNDANEDGQYTLRLRATDSANHVTEQALNVSLSNINEAPSAQPQTFSVSEFAEVSNVLGSVQASDPENDRLHWTLLTADSPFTLHDNGELRVNGTLNFEAIASFSLSVQVSDDVLNSNTLVTVNLIDENEITRLVQNLPTNAHALTAEGITRAVTGRESYYNNAIEEANPQPNTLARLQVVIDRANATAELVEGGASTDTSIVQSLTDAGVTGTQTENSTAYLQAIANASPPPTSPAELQAIVEEINNVQSLLATANSQHSGSSDTTALKNALYTLSSVPFVPENLLDELAAMINRVDPSPTSEAQIAALVTVLLQRAIDHPVVYLSLEQDGVQVQQVRVEGGTATVTAHVANPVPGLLVSYDWQASDDALYILSSVPSPITEQFSFEPAVLAAGDSLTAQVTATRNGLHASINASIVVAPPHTNAAARKDTDGDGVNDTYEGELEASVDATAANRLQTVRGDDLYYVMEGPPGSILRLGQVARAALKNQVTISLDDMVRHIPGATVALVIDELPSAVSAADTEVFDFEIASLPRAGSSVVLFLPLQRVMDDHAAYVKFHPATGWTDFVEDGLNQLRSAPALAGILGQCPQGGHNAYSEGLSEGHACIELTIEDGGPNDADRLNSDGTVATDGGINGNIKDPGAIVYTQTGALNSGNGTLNTGVKGGGSTEPTSLALITLLALRRRRRQCGAVF